MSDMNLEASPYDRFVQAVREYLRDQQATNSQRACGAAEIVNGIKAGFGDWRNPSSLRILLSKAANEDNSSGIVSLGRGRGGGYWLNELVQTTVEAITKASKEEELARREGRVQRETALYSPIKRWLALLGQRSQITAAQRGSQKWSNPDVVGIRVARNFGLTDIEITSVEVKVSSASWRHDIFEAISHKRFANCVYYCYPVTEGLDKLDEDQSRYAELYKIGILHVYLEELQLDTILAGPIVPPNLLDGIDVVEAVEVRIPAPYDFISPRYQIEFLKSLGLSDDEALWNFGATTDNIV